MTWITDPRCRSHLSLNNMERQSAIVLPTLSTPLRIPLSCATCSSSARTRNWCWYQTPLLCSTSSSCCKRSCNAFLHQHSYTHVSLSKLMQSSCCQIHVNRIICEHSNWRLDTEHYTYLREWHDWNLLQMLTCKLNSWDNAHSITSYPSVYCEACQKRQHRSHLYSHLTHPERVSG